MALTLPSSNGASYLSARPENIQLNSHFNGGLTQTTATVTPTRLKNIEESFREHSNLPPKPELHQHMAGFVTPSVNISLFVKPPSHFNITNINLNQAIQDNLRPIDYYNSSTNSNSNDSCGYSDDYSSEASSSAFENSSISFNTIPEMNNSSSSRGKKASAATAKSRKSNQSTNMTGSSQQKPKKSTGGGRKPTRNDKLTPEEEQKRAKRRERNKLAAARCRKRRLDQTNTLMDKVTDKEDEHLELVNKLNDLLSHMTAMKKHIEAHANYNCKSKRMLLEEMELFASIDYEAMNEAMRPIDDDDDYSDLIEPTTPKPVVKSEPQDSVTGVNFSSATSVIVSSNNVSANLINFANVISNQLQPSASTSDLNNGSQKRKRPNTLPVSNPYKVATVCESSNTFNTNPLQTPSSGLLFGDFDGGTGLTPLMPTLTPSELTPSTMAAFVKSLASPMDESDQKKLIII